MNGRASARLALAGAFFLGLVTPSLLPACAWAQSADSSSGQIQDQPLAPPPGTSETTVPMPDSAGPPAAPPAPQAPSAATAPAVAAPSQWVPEQQAQLTILDKIYGSATTVSARLGTPFAIRFLTVTVLACWVRPPSLPPDSAVFLQVTDSHAAPGSPPEFRGWIFRAEPALSGMNDPATDISVNGCG
jgi:hypothetical protein